MGRIGIPGNYLPLTGGTMTGNATFVHNRGVFVTESGGATRHVLLCPLSTAEVAVGATTNPLRLRNNGTLLDYQAAASYAVRTAQNTIVKRKPSDEAVGVDVTTLQPDDDFVLSVPANSIWHVTCRLLLQVGASGFQWGWSTPSGATVTGDSLYYAAGGSLTHLNLPSSSTTYASDQSVVVHACIAVGGTAGTISLLWACATAGGSAAGVRAGSSMQAVREL